MTISALRSAWVRPLGFAVQLLVFSRDGITLGFGAAFLGSQCQEDEGVPLAAPRRQQRRLQTFAAE
jgi:hypothetical protein